MTQRRWVRDFIDEVEGYVNVLSDMDAQWWPFLFLRPSPRERLSTVRSGLLALLYGLFGGVLANVVCVLAGHPHEPWVLPLFLTGSLFVIYRGLFACCWNRRTARLLRLEANQGRWGTR